MIRVKISALNMMVCDCGRPPRRRAAGVAPELGRHWAKNLAELGKTLECWPAKETDFIERSRHVM